MCARQRYHTTVTRIRFTSFHSYRFRYGCTSGSRYRFVCAVACICLAVTGCSVSPTQPPDSPKVIESNNIERLLREAEDAFHADRLTTPRRDSAYLLYQQILLLDPVNQDALNGLARIADRYLSWSLDHARNGNIQRARHFLGLAETVDPAHPNIGPVAKLINDLEQRHKETYTLSATTVVNRNSRDQQLDEIAGRIVQTRAFVTIRAPDDASGRWIYQQLNNRVSFRVEARFLNSRPSTVELTFEP